MAIGRIRRCRFHYPLIGVLCVQMALPNLGAVHASWIPPQPPTSLPPGLEGGGDGVTSGLGQFSGGFRSAIGCPPPPRGGATPRGGKGGAYEAQAYKGDDDIGGQGQGGVGGGLGAPGPAGIGSGGGTGKGDGNGGGQGGFSMRISPMRVLLVSAIAVINTIASYSQLGSSLPGGGGFPGGGGLGGPGGGAAGCCPPGNCPPPDDPPQPPGPANPDPPGPEATPDPVFLRYGSATETAADLEVAGPLGTWRYTRAYNSFEGVRTASSNQGWGWLSNRSDQRVVQVEGNNIVRVILRADSQFYFYHSVHLGKYTGAGGWTKWQFTRDTTAKEFHLINPRSGEYWVFYDFHSDNGNKKGRLKETTTTWWNGAGKVGSTYDYTTDGKLDFITTPDGQAYKIDFTYDTNGRVTAIEVVDGTTVLMKAAYTYYTWGGGYSSDLGGTEGDLIQVKLSKLVSGGSDWQDPDHVVDRYTQYRYDGDSRLEAIFNHDGIYSLVADNSNINNPNDILTKADDYSTGSSSSHQVKDFADRLYTYYDAALATNAVDTVFTPGTATEDLQYKYNGSNTGETTWTGSTYGDLVKQGIDRPSGCGGCGGSGSSSGLKYEYYYMYQDHGENPLTTNDVAWIVVEDISDGNNNPIKRRVWGFNNTGHILRQVTIDNPVPGQGQSSTYWCSSRKMTTDGGVWQYRLHSAHAIVDTDSEVRAFFNPSNGTNDDDTLNSDTGFIWLYEYDIQGRHKATRIKEGRDDTSPAYEEYIEYYTGTDLAYRLYSFPTRVSSDPTTNGVYTEYDYTFWDPLTKTRIKSRKITPPVVSTEENGSGQLTYLWEHYDEAGRLRWTKNGEGYVTYRAYHPKFGSLAYQMRDVDTSSLGSEITSGSAGKWETWNDPEYGASVPTDLARASGLPTALKLVTKNEYDSQARIVRRIYPGGNQNYLKYEKYRTVVFPYVDSTTGMPAVPVMVTAWDIAHRNTEVYAVDPAKTVASNGEPTGLNANTTQADYVALTRNNYDAVTGALTRLDEYHDIPSSGNGSLGTNFYSTHLLHTPIGKHGATIRYVDTNRYQVIAVLYNIHDQAVETRRGVATAVAASYGALDDDLGTTPTGFLGYAKIQSTEYDSGGVGDGYITSTRSFFGTTANDYAQTVYHRTFRGHLRGIERRSASGDITPYTAMDIDWFGETTASATYSSEPNWATLEGGYNAYVNDTFGSTGRNNLTVTFYDALGRKYRTDHFPGTESTKHFETNNYFDRRDLVVATGDTYSAQAEYAYDGAARPYQSRTVLKLKGQQPSEDFYSGGSLQYINPNPHPTLTSMSTSQGNDGIIEFTHEKLDSAGNTLETHTFELNHDDTNGLSLTSNGKPVGGVRRSVYFWYDAGDRVRTIADFGSRDADDGDSAWAAADLPNPQSEPTASDANKLVTRFLYEASSGRRSIVTDPKDAETKSFYDDASRRIAVAENWVNYNAVADTGAGGGAINEEDRVTKFAYNGLGRQTQITAVNVTSSGTVDQETNYHYLDDYSALPVTHTVYPDSTSTPASGTDLVKLEYNLDGTLKMRTDQRGVVIEYTYNSRRQLSSEQVVTVPAGVDSTVRAIHRTYDNQGRPTAVTSGDSPQLEANDQSVVNDVQYTYGSQGQVTQVKQYHVRYWAAYQTVHYAYDETADGTTNIYTNGLRLKMVTYPNGREIHTTYGSADSIADRLGRANMLEADSGGSPGIDLVQYSYNGTDRLAVADYLVPAVKLDLYQGTSGTYAGYDRFGRIVRHEWDKYDMGAGVLDRFDYTYDYAGNRLTRDVTAAANDTRDQKYGYDGLHRLKNYDQGTLASGSITSSNKQRSWTLDQLGNWAGTFLDLEQTTSEQVREHTAANEIETVDSSGTHVAHDESGNMIKLPKPDNWSAHFDLKYDAWNRLVEVKDGSNVVQQNKYDGIGRRIVRSVYASGLLDHRIHYYYNEEWQILEERKEVSGTENANPLNQYIWHPYYLDALAQRWYDHDTSGSGIAVYYYLQDANFNVTAAIDNSGTVVERYSYTPYGEVTVLDLDFAADADGASDIGSTHLYTGRERDPETTLQLNRWRYYSWHMGGWITRDPVGYIGSEWNLYEYVNSSPNGHIDPFGEWNLNPGGGWLPPMPPLPPPPGTGSGFQVCRRDVQPGTDYEKIINGCGGAHTYLQYGPCEDDGTPGPYCVGWGFSGGGAGQPPTPEVAFNPDKSRDLNPRKNGGIKNGRFKGTPCSQATDAMIADCVQNSRTTGPYDYPSYVCSDWVEEAIADCCLE
jgi:RHS repeat-associated protein